MSNRFVWIVLGGTLFFGLIGFVDDYLKLVVRNSKGLTARDQDLLAVALARSALAIAFYLTAENPGVEHALLIPYFKNVTSRCRPSAYVALTALVIVGSSNAVNLTDGLDGLAIMPAVLVGAALGVFAYAAGNVIYRELSRDPVRGGSRRAAGFLCGPGWRRPGLLVVQHLSRAGLHG